MLSMPLVRTRRSVLQRLHAHITPQGDCWLWTGYVDNRGRGIINIDHRAGHPVLVQRAMYEATYGSPPKGIYIRQHCEKTLCIRPEHLILLTNEYRFWLCIDQSPHPNDCWLWTGKAFTAGYGVMKYHNKNILVHRLAFLLAHGYLPHNLCVLHHCDVRACVNPAHLFLGTNQDNVDDKMYKGRHVAPQGEDHGNAKLSSEDAQAIRSLKGLEPRGDVAKRFGISLHTVMKIQQRIAWKHLP